MGFLRVAEGEVALFLDPHAVPVSFKGPAPDSFCSKIQEGKGEQGPDSFRSISISPISSSILFKIDNALSGSFKTSLNLPKFKYVFALAKSTGEYSLVATISLPFA